MLLRTKSLKYDDRFRKECKMFQEFGVNVSLGLVESDNNKNEKFFSNGANCVRIGLVSRVLPSASFVVLKTLEMYVRFMLLIIRERPSVLWIHNMEMAGIALASRTLRRVGLVGAIVWDQHELPSDRTLRSQVWRWALFHTISRIDGVVVANPEREKLLRRLGILKAPSLSLENYADREFSQSAKQNVAEELSIWLSGEQYYLAQGGASPGRNFEVLAEAVIKRGDRLVVVGDRPEARVRHLKQKFGDVVHQHIFFTGWVEQKDVAHFIDGARAAIVFYSTNSRNGRYCAPNRLYQALSRGLPVIVGCNPPLKRLVESYGCGIVASTDGRDLTDVLRSLDCFDRAQDRVCAASRKLGEMFVFERQYDDVSHWLKLVMQGNGDR